MNTSWYPKDAARICRDYTGEPHQFLRGLSRDERPGLLPAAHPAQALLEAQVMESLATGGEYWAHPLGISSLRITSGGIVVLLDSHTTLYGGGRYDMARYAVERVLPYAEVGIQVTGPIGVRVREIRGRDLVLSSVLGEGRVVLRGAPGVQWATRLREWQADVSDDLGHVPLWDARGLTGHEREHMGEHSSSWSAKRRLAWLGSGLLRRVALFQTSSSAYSTRSWTRVDSWVFELDSTDAVPPGHDAFLDRLTTPPFGLPLKAYKHYCGCYKEFAPGRSSLQCTYNLTVPARGDDPHLELRFRSMAPPDGTRQDFAAVGADPDWLDRVLPPEPPRPAPRFPTLVGGAR